MRAWRCDEWRERSDSSGRLCETKEDLAVIVLLDKPGWQQLLFKIVCASVPALVKSYVFYAGG
jgi:hypothetical protein